MAVTLTAPEGASVIRKMALTVLFLFFLYPISSSSGISINYSFALFPLMVVMCLGGLKWPPTMLSVAMLIFTLIFIFSLWSQLELVNIAPRRAVSFLVFMTLFAFVFIRIDMEMIVAFKLAIVLISAYFSLVSIVLFCMINSAGPVGYEAKVLVGSQRYGFIYIIAFWLVLLYRAPTTVLAIGKYVVLLLVLAGLFLTFSRSSIVALLAGGGVYLFASFLQWCARPTRDGFLRAVNMFLCGGVIVSLIYQFFPLTIEFYGDRLFGFFGSGEVVSHLGDSQTSEGTRVYIVQIVLEYIASHPLTGSGYLGVWMLPDAITGSAHNQYVDVLFRTGIVGFGVYCYLIARVLRYLYLSERELFWGIVCVLVYGMVHETFKESQGAVVLAFILGMMSQSLRDRNVYFRGNRHIF